MKDSIHQKLEYLTARYATLGALLSDAEVIADRARHQKCGKEYAQLEPIVACFKRYLANEEATASANTLLTEADPEMQALATEELEALRGAQETIEAELKHLLLPKDPDDQCNVFLEIRAGTGGEEAALFAGDLLRMYLRYVETQGWKAEVISEAESEHGGFKEVIVRIVGQQVYSRLKFESGAHRVQRVPATETQGRIHTSACTIAVLPEVEAIDDIDINPADLRTDTFRASGAGGQHVNKTDSAIRITHVPTGVVVECQEDRSQHKNRAKAMTLLRAKLLSVEKDKQAAEQAQTRRNLVGSGDRSERIRTYNFPQGRVTDHRVNLTLYKLEEILAGQLDHVIEPLIREHQADQLAAGDQDQ